MINGALFPVSASTIRTWALPIGNGNPLSKVTNSWLLYSRMLSGTDSTNGGPKGRLFWIGANVVTVLVAPVFRLTLRSVFEFASGM